MKGNVNVDRMEIRERGKENEGRSNISGAVVEEVVLKKKK